MLGFAPSLSEHFIFTLRLCVPGPLHTCPSVEKKGEIDKLAAEYIANVKTLASEQRVEHLQKIESAYGKCREYSDDKVQLAMQTYEMVRAVPLGRAVLWRGDSLTGPVPFHHRWTSTFAGWTLTSPALRTS